MARFRSRRAPARRSTRSSGGFSRARRAPARRRAAGRGAAGRGARQTIRIEVVQPQASAVARPEFFGMMQAAPPIKRQF